MRWQEKQMPIVLFFSAILCKRTTMSEYIARPSIVFFSFIPVACAVNFVKVKFRILLPVFCLTNSFSLWKKIWIWMILFSHYLPTISCPCGSEYTNNEWYEMKIWWIPIASIDKHLCLLVSEGHSHAVIPGNLLINVAK